jgi:hypothetical protein
MREAEDELQRELAEQELASKSAEEKARLLAEKEAMLL